MPGVARKGDVSQGHGCFPSRPNITGSSTTFVDDKPVHRKGDKWLIHQCKDNVHDGILSSGSNTVFVDNKPIGRIGDSISCGDKVMTGSTSVFVD